MAWRERKSLIGGFCRRPLGRSCGSACKPRDPVPVDGQVWVRPPGRVLVGRASRRRFDRKSGKVAGWAGLGRKVICQGEYYVVVMYARELCDLLIAGLARLSSDIERRGEMRFASACRRLSSCNPCSTSYRFFG